MVISAMSGAVHDSVQQISSEAKKLIDKASDVNFLDISIAAHNLKEAVSDMEDLFEKNPEDTKNLIIKKRLTEERGLLLEYFLSVKTGDFKDRYRLRQYINCIYQDVSDLFKEKAACGKPEVLAKWASHTHSIISIHNKSKHLLFSLTKEEEEILSIIVTDLKEERT